MNYTSRSLQRVLLGAAFAVVFSLKAYPQAATPDETVELPRFDVSAQAADRYRPIESQSVIRVAGSILDSPFSVNVVPRELLNDLGANAAFDVTRYFPGVSPGRGTAAGGIQDRQDFRGFENLSRTIDNFSSFLLPTGSGFQATFDPAFIERIELVMGPNSVLSPTGSPGGSTNIITKSPQFKEASEVSVMLGNYNAQKLTVDATGPFSPGSKWAYRIVGSAQDTKTYVPGKLEQYNGSGMLTYQIGPNAKLELKYFGEQWGLYGPIGATNDNGEIVYTPNTVGGAFLQNAPQPGFKYGGSNAVADFSTRIDRVNIGEATFTAGLGSHVNMRLGAEILYDRVGQVFAFPRSAPGETFDPATGQAIAVGAFNPASITEVGQISHSQNRQIQFQNDYVANFHEGPVTIQPVVGWASQAGRIGNNYTLVNNNAADLPPANLLITNSYSPPLPAVTPADYTFSANLPEVASLFQVYGLVRAGFFNDHVFLTGGASRIWARVNDYSLKGVNLPGVGQFGADPSSAGYVSDFTFNNTGNALAPTQSRTHDTYLGGILVKPIRSLSIYGSVSTNAGIAANNPLWQAGKQYELGLKSEFFNQRLQFTAAHFQITQSNVSTPNPLFNTGQSNVSSLLSNQTNHGEEFSVIGGILPNLSIIGSLTAMKLRDPLGRRVRNIPDHIANVLLNYRITSGLLRDVAIFAGANHLGSVAGETVSAVTALGVPEVPGFYLKPWTVMNVGASYSYSRFRFNLDVENALNDHFWWQPASRISVSPYPGTTVRLTTTTRF